MKAQTPKRARERETQAALLGFLSRQSPALAEEIEIRGHDAVTESLLRKLARFSTYGQHALPGETCEAELDRPCFEQVKSLYSVRGRARSRPWTVLTSDEQVAILSKVKGDDLDAQRDRASLSLLFGAGLRAAEVVALDLGHFRTRGPEADLLVRGIGGHQRVVPVVGRALDCLSEYVANRRALSYADTGDSRALFLMDQDQGSRFRMERLSREELQATFEKACGAARIDSVCHDVALARHSFALSLYAATSDLQLVGQVMDLRGIWLPRIGFGVGPRRIRQSLERLAVNVRR